MEGASERDLHGMEGAKNTLQSLLRVNHIETVRLYLRFTRVDSSFRFAPYEPFRPKSHQLWHGLCHATSVGRHERQLHRLQHGLR